MDARTSSRDRIARHRAAQRKRGLRQVVLRLPDTNDPGYQTRLAEECKQLGQLTPDEDTMMTGFARLAERTEGWQ
nr:antitoxin MazE-like protein [uncultured Rhodopila sp.]